MTTNKEEMKSLLVRDKGFLKELYEGENFRKNKNLILFASENQLDTLIKFLHFLSTGQIKMKKENFNKLTIRKLNLIKRNVEKKTKLSMLISADRQQKVKFLLQLVNFFHYLLDTLFND